MKYINPVGSDFDEHLESDLKDPEMAAYFINAAVEEHDASYLKVALGKVVRVHGVTEISKMAKLNRESIYKMLGPDSNPGFEYIVEILDACGLEIAVQPKGLVSEKEQKLETQYVSRDDLIEIISGTATATIEAYMLKNNLRVAKAKGTKRKKAKFSGSPSSNLKRRSGRTFKITSGGRAVMAKHAIKKDRGA